MTKDPNVWWPTEPDRDLNKGWLQPLRRLMRDLSVRKIVRLAIILTMSGVCWLGVGCIALELLQLAAH